MVMKAYPAIIIVMLISLFLFYNFRVDASAEYGKQSTEYEEHLSKACRAAVNATEMKKDKTLVYLFDTEEKREKATVTFFQTLEQGFNYVYDSNHQIELRQHVPVLCLIDTDGYYMYYNAVYTGSDGGTYVSQTMTPINTWGYVTDNGRYLIRYYLSDYVEVTDTNTQKTCTGTYTTAYQYFHDEVGLAVLRDKETFELYKRDYIISEMNEKMEYYINQYNQSVNRVNNAGYNDYDIHYTFELPKVKYEDWCNLLEKPAAMALLQGIQFYDGSDYLNIYAMAGGEIDFKKGYYVNTENGDTCYHRPICSMVTEVSRYYKTKEECAKMGYFPCEICNP